MIVRGCQVGEYCCVLVSVSESVEAYDRVSGDVGGNAAQDDQRLFQVVRYTEDVVPYSAEEDKDDKGPGVVGDVGVPVDAHCIAQIDC